MPTLQELLEPGNYYHIYNRAVGNENLFVKKENYFFFLERFNKYIKPVADTFAYCLLPNHFHFLLRIKSENEVSILEGKDKTLQGFQTLAGLKFSHLFNSYAQAYNKQQNRSGSLFKNRFKRKKITDENYLKQLVLYIHLNPVKHKIFEPFSEWDFSSYNEIINGRELLVKSSETISWFEDIDNFIYCHNNKFELEYNYKLEDEN